MIRFKNIEDNASQSEPCVVFAEERREGGAHARGGLVDDGYKHNKRTSLSTTVAELSECKM